ncbi:MAG: thioredoxin fold domain-containing protein [Pseudomonas sp.]|uniref:thioredoxin fold domain-containing protein n=1 Tax=Pseudomonas sp. TaxID=306 RepID=UPI002736D89F|nr:thioredoxin fold domain-containing protein [Pseudomonas sp.]MDP3848461.1 thioredoxin fold domain-containing protein [Pseudomonas sp.]
MRLCKIVSVVALGLLGNFALAAAPADPDQAIRQSLKSIDPDMKIEAIAESPLTGVFEVHLQGGRVLYSSADGQYMLQGFLYQFKNGQALNLTEQVKSKAIAKEINAVPLSEMVVFAPKAPKTHITVFTDTDCGYCQKLHREVPELNRLGVEVRYMAFPRQGLASNGYNGLVSVWCAKDRQAAMTAVKARKELPPGTCENPVAKQYELGQLIGIDGTPAIVLANGELIPGYRPAPELAKLALEAK